jgi:hypothetical protein
VSFNCPNLHIVEDGGASFHRVDPYEQEDALKTFATMGATVRTGPGHSSPFSERGVW